MTILQDIWANKIVASTPGTWAKSVIARTPTSIEELSQVSVPTHVSAREAQLALCSEKKNPFAYLVLAQRTDLPRRTFSL